MLATLLACAGLSPSRAAGHGRLRGTPGAEAAPDPRDHHWQTRLEAAQRPRLAQVGVTIDVTGSEAADTILFHQNADGSLSIAINGNATTYTADQSSTDRSVRSGGQ